MRKLTIYFVGNTITYNILTPETEKFLNDTFLECLQRTNTTALHLSNCKEPINDPEALHIQMAHFIGWQFWTAADDPKESEHAKFHEAQTEMMKRMIELWEKSINLEKRGDEWQGEEDD